MLPMLLQILFVEECLAQNKFKLAAKAVWRLELQQDFPDVEALLQSPLLSSHRKQFPGLKAIWKAIRILSPVLASGRWGEAAMYVGHDAWLQVCVQCRYQLPQDFFSTDYN